MTRPEGLGPRVASAISMLLSIEVNVKGMWAGTASMDHALLSSKPDGRCPVVAIAGARKH